MKRQIIMFLFMTISVLSFGQSLNLSLVFSMTPLCNGDANGEARVIASGGTSNYTYLWNTSPPQMTETASNLAAGTYNVSVFDGVDTATLNVDIINPPLLTCEIIVIQNDTNAQGTGILLCNVNGGTIPYSFFWGANTGYQNSNLAINLTSGNYSVSVSDANNCHCVSSNLIISASCSAQYILVSDTIPQHYSAISYVSGVPPLTYTWSWGDGGYDYIQFPNHTYNSAGNYTICLTITDSNGCTDTFCDSSYLQKSPNDIIYVNVIPYGTTEIIANKISNLIKAYPNPNNGKFTVTKTDNIKIIEVINMLGEVIYSLIPNNNHNSTEIDLTAFPKGIYFVKVDNCEKVHIEKVILN